MIKKKRYILLFFVTVATINHIAAMDDLGIENPFARKKTEEISLTLDASDIQEGFFARSITKKHSNNIEEQHGHREIDHDKTHVAGSVSYKRVRAKEVRMVPHMLGALDHGSNDPEVRFNYWTKKGYADVFEKNDNRKYMCPYNNCNYAKEAGSEVVKHIKRAHDKDFNLQTFDCDTADLDVYIKRKRAKKYADVFEKNDDGAFLCPYDCAYTHRQGKRMGRHIKSRHDKNFDLQTFDPTTVDLDAYVPTKKKRHVDVFEVNENDEYMCLYKCRDNYVNTNGDRVVQHIKERHDKNFGLQTFDRDTADLDVYINRKKGRKRYVDVFEKNEHDKFMCPYNNCPDNYTHIKGPEVASHIKRRHNKCFRLEKFDRQKADLNAWIPRVRTSRQKRLRTCDDVFEKNENEEYVCPYYCPDNYTHSVGREVERHIRVRHDLQYNRDTFNCESIDLEAWIPRKARGTKVKWGDRFKKNEKNEYMCPYNCYDNYSHEDGNCVMKHIRARHDKTCKSNTFDPTNIDSNAWIPRKTGVKRKRPCGQADIRGKKKKRKMTI